MGRTWMDYLSWGIIVLSPFGDLPYLYGSLGGQATQGGFIIAGSVAILMTGWGLYKSEHWVKQQRWLIVLIFILVAGSLSNIDEIGRLSVEKGGFFEYIKTIGSISIGATVAMMIRGTSIKERGRMLLEQAIMIAWWTGCSYCLMQFVAAMSNNGLVNLIIDSVNQATRIPNEIGFSKRISGFKPEPSVLAVWFALYFPFILKWATSSRKLSINNSLMLVVGIIVAVAAGGRSIMIVLIVETLIYIGLLAKERRIRIWKMMVSAVVPCVITLIVVTALGSAGGLKLVSSPESLVNSLGEFEASRNAVYLQSNMTRYNLALGGFNAFKERWALGYGLGQAPFAIAETNRITEYMQEGTSVLSLYIKLLLEIGLVGTSYLTFLYLGAIKKLNSNSERSGRSFTVGDPKALIAVGAGLLITFFSNDNLGYFEVWIYLGLLSATLSQKLKKCGLEGE